MRTFFLMLCCMFSVATAHAAQTCKTDSIPASTPNSQLTDNGDGTVTDRKTGLMWKQCLEGVSGNLCETDSPSSFTWQLALQQSGVVNDAGGFAGFRDWRLPNIRELRSLAEEQCCYPAINSDRFPDTLSPFVWSGSPYAHNSDYAWYVYFGSGSSGQHDRNDYHAVRLVRGGQ